MAKFNCIDLFAGCGGLTEGFYQEDFHVLAHVEINHFACETLKERMKFYGYKNYESAVLEEDITKPEIIEKIKNVIGNKQVDVIIGGPPCQSFSSAGRAKDEMGMKNDPRNYLFESYVRILNEFEPKYFVFENVTGILTAHPNGESKIINTIINALGEKYKVVLNPTINILNSANYGVPQIRRRVIFIGVRKDLPYSPEEIYSAIEKTNYDPEMPIKERNGLKKYVTVRDAIAELPSIEPGEGKDSVSFKPTFANDFLRAICSPKQDYLLDHICRKHNETDRERYRVMAENHYTFDELLQNRPDLGHAKKRVFNNSYTVQWWDLPSKTILAHIHKDGNLFIHPDYTQARTFTVREAARIQSFPDNFVFKGNRSEKYKQIGNAVPPLFAKAIAKAIKKYLKEDWLCSFVMSLRLAILLKKTNF